MTITWETDTTAEENNKMKWKKKRSFFFLHLNVTERRMAIGAKILHISSNEYKFFRENINVQQSVFDLWILFSTRDHFIKIHRKQITFTIFFFASSSNRIIAKTKKTTIFWHCSIFGFHFIRFLCEIMGNSIKFGRAD